MLTSSKPELASFSQKIQFFESQELDWQDALDKSRKKQDSFKTQNVTGRDCRRFSIFFLDPATQICQRFRDDKVFQELKKITVCDNKHAIVATVQDLRSEFKPDLNYWNHVTPLYWARLEAYCNRAILHKNLDDSMIENSPAFLIYLAFHPSDAHVRDDWNFEFNFQKEWGKYTQSNGHQLALCRGSNALLNRAISILLQENKLFLQEKNGKNKRKIEENKKIIKELLFLAVGNLHASGLHRPEAYFLLAEVILDESNEKDRAKNLLLAFHLFIFYIYCLDPKQYGTPDKDDMVQSHIDNWAKRHPKETHPLIEMMENWYKEIFILREEITRKIEVYPGTLSVEAIYEIIYSEVIQNYGADRTLHGRSLSRAEQPWIREFPAFYTTLYSPSVREYSLRYNSNNPQNHKNFLRGITLFLKQLSSITEGQVDDAICEKSELKFTLKSTRRETREEEAARKAKGEANENKTAETKGAGRKQKSEAEELKENKKEEKSIEFILSQPRVRIYVGQIEALQKSFTAYFEGKIENLFSRLRLGKKELNLHNSITALFNFMKGILARTQDKVTEKEKPELLLLEEKNRQKSEEKKTEQKKEVPPAEISTEEKEKQAAEIFSKEYAETRSREEKSYFKKWYNYELYSLRENAADLTIESIVLHAMKNPVNSKNGKGGNRTARILYYRYGIAVDKRTLASDSMPQMTQDKIKGAIGPGRATQIQSFYDTFCKICVDDAKLMESFESKHAQEYKPSLKSRSAYKKEDKKTLVRTLYETRNNTGFSSHFFSRKRSHDVFVKLGAQIDGCDLLLIDISSLEDKETKERPLEVVQKAAKNNNSPLLIKTKEGFSVYGNPNKPSSPNRWETTDFKPPSGSNSTFAEPLSDAEWTVLQRVNFTSEKISRKDLPAPLLKIIQKGHEGMDASEKAFPSERMRNALCSRA